MSIDPFSLRDFARSLVPGAATLYAFKLLDRTLEMPSFQSTTTPTELGVFIIVSFVLGQILGALGRALFHLISDEESDPKPTVLDERDRSHAQGKKGSWITPTANFRHNYNDLIKDYHQRVTFESYLKADNFSVPIQQVAVDQIYASVRREHGLINRYDDLVLLYEQTRALFAGALVVCIFAVYVYALPYLITQQSSYAVTKFRFAWIAWMLPATKLVIPVLVARIMYYLARKTGRDAARELAVQYIAVGPLRDMRSANESVKNRVSQQKLG